MTDTAREVFARLDALGVAYEYVEHPPVYTIQDCLETDGKLLSVTAKNYFLTTKNKKNFYLCLVRPEARFKTSDISKQAGSSRLSFAGEEHMARLLRVHPGAVSPMGLMFDENREVSLLVDSGLKDVSKIAFHPCDNTCTLAMAASDFFDKFLPGIGREPVYVEIHDFLDAQA
ncbi:MAG: prolyl-tRNA synthetase associated domain-containing protein [Clostridia bacterium]|nr:prolyl-tRNA synthetase associated domain-containing protein [Clostridia bacterium]